MLILTLILWWARAPIRFFDGRPRTAMAIVAISTLAFPCGMVSSNCIAEDRYYTGPRRSSLISTPEEQQKRIVDLPKNQKRLREGTLIPPTIGRVVLRGRRWEFISEAADAASGDDLASINSNRDRRLVGLYSGALMNRPHGESRATRIPASTDRQASLVSTPATVSEQAPMLPTSIILTENLMLQRIAEAIRANPSDDRWIVSGEITEFFDENRMIIRTAQRSNTN